MGAQPDGAPLHVPNPLVQFPQKLLAAALPLGAVYDALDVSGADDAAVPERADETGLTGRTQA